MQLCSGLRGLGNVSQPLCLGFPTCQMNTGCLTRHCTQMRALRSDDIWSPAARVGLDTISCLPGLALSAHSIPTAHHSQDDP